MHRLLYSSLSVVPLSDEELQVLLGASRVNNATAGITGVLVHVVSPETFEAAFVQVLEGERDAVERTYVSIEKDDLHGQLTVLSQGDVEERMFGEWTMRLEETSITGDAPLADVIRDPVAMQTLVSRYLPGTSGRRVRPSPS